MGRFLNADALISTGQGILGYNMVTYCGNNPSIFADYSGFVYVLVHDYSGRHNTDVSNIINEIIDNITNPSDDNLTFSVGLTGNGTYHGLGKGFSGCLSVDSSYNYALQKASSTIVSYGTGLSFSGGLNITITNADYVTDLDGKSLSGGFTIVSLMGISVDLVSFIPNSNPETTNYGISITLAAGAGASVQSAQTHTETVWLQNPLKTLQNILFGG